MPFVKSPTGKICLALEPEVAGLVAAEWEVLSEQAEADYRQLLNADQDMTSHEAQEKARIEAGLYDVPSIATGTAAQPDASSAAAAKNGAVDANAAPANSSSIGKTDTPLPGRNEDGNVVSNPSADPVTGKDADGNDVAGATTVANPDKAAADSEVETRDTAMPADASQPVDSSTTSEAEVANGSPAASEAADAAEAAATSAPADETEVPPAKAEDAVAQAAASDSAPVETETTSTATASEADSTATNEATDETENGAGK
jgi:hypothetical protein